MSDPSKYYSISYRSCVIAVVIAGFILLATNIGLVIYFGVTNKPTSTPEKTEFQVQTNLPSSTPEVSTDLPINVSTTTPDTTPTDCCQCPDTWLTFKGSCYLFSHEGKTFTDAVSFCTQLQSQLVKIENQDENNFLKSHAADLKDAHRWIGLTDIAIEGTWVWMDGSDAEFTSWAPREPNGQKEENCAGLWNSESHLYDWNDKECSGLVMPICEKALYPC